MCDVEKLCVDKGWRATEGKGSLQMNNIEVNLQLCYESD